MRYRVSPSAKRDLREIFVFWAERAGEQVANRLIDEIVNRFPALGAFPEIGRDCAELGPNTRSFPAGQYLIYFRKRRGAVSILRVIHGARDQRRAVRKPRTK